MARSDSRNSVRAREDSLSRMRCLIRKSLGLKTGNDVLEGGDVGLSRLGFERMVVDSVMVKGDDEAFVAMERGDGKTSGQISCRPF